MGGEGNGSGAGGPLLGKLSAAAATLGAFIAVGQAGSQWIKGMSDAELAKIKAKQDIEIQEAQATATMAEEYLKMVISKDVAPPDKLMLLGALSQLDKHPLQKWASNRSKEIQTELTETLSARKKRTEELIAERDPDEQTMLSIQNIIQELTDEMQRKRDDPEEGSRLEHEITTQAQQLATLRGRIATKKTVLTTVSAEGTVTATGASELKTTVLVDRLLTVQFVQKAFPAAPTSNIQKHLPTLISAIKEFSLLDPKLIGVVLGTISAETPAFEPASEFKSRFNTSETGFPFDLYERRGDLGNTTDGDGARFKGRGFLQITGRALYTRMSQRLGLGTLLTESPDLANDPAIAARTLCAYIVDKDKEQGLKPALETGDLRRARRILIGGTQGLLPFTDTYKYVVAQLSSRRSSE